MITICKIMIYFDFPHLRIYIDLNERVFIIVTGVIDTVLGSITRYISKHGSTLMMSLWSLSSSYVFNPIYLMYSTTSIACCNFIVLQFYIVIQLCSSIVVYLFRYCSCNLHSFIVNYAM